MPTTTKPKTSPAEKSRSTGVPAEGYSLPAPTEEQVRRKAGELGVPAGLVVQIAVAEWLRQQAEQG